MNRLPSRKRSRHEKFIELLLCILHPIAVILIWINLLALADIGLVAKLTWAIVAIIPFVPFVYASPATISSDNYKGRGQDERVPHETGIHWLIATTMRPSPHSPATDGPLESDVSKPRHFAAPPRARQQTPAR